jgi:hypothetical protein
MGGDEFCIVVRNASEAELVVTGATRALAEHGEGFSISAAYGAVLLPAEATDPQDALRLADQRMYENKQGARLTASEQSSGVLLRALSERHPKLGAHSAGVADLAEAVARQLGFPEEEASRTRLAGALHEIGKMAIPDQILQKPGDLTDDEWTFVRTHTVIGERILHAATALRYVAGLVRPPRALRRAVPGRSRGHGHSAHLADRPRVRRVRRDDVAAAVRRRADHRGGSRSCNARGTQFDPIVVTPGRRVADRGARRASPRAQGSRQAQADAPVRKHGAPRSLRSTE